MEYCARMGIQACGVCKFPELPELVVLFPLKQRASGIYSQISFTCWWIVKHSQSVVKMFHVKQYGPGSEESGAILLTSERAACPMRAGT